MFSSYTDANLVEDNSPEVTYSCEPVLDGADVVYWKLSRRARHSYHYVGMSESTAKTAADEIRDSLTRRYMRWTADYSDGELDVRETYVLECSASVKASHVEGSMWQVDVDIDDNDEVVSENEVSTVDDIKNYFAIAETRGFSSNKISIISARWVSSTSTVEVEYAHTIQNATLSLMKAVIVDSGGTETVVSVSNASANSLKFSSSENCEFYLRYESSPVVSSRHFKTNSFQQPTIAVIETWLEMSSVLTGEEYRKFCPEYHVRFTSDMVQTTSSFDILVGGKSGVSLVKLVDEGYSGSLFTYQAVFQEDGYFERPALSGQIAMRLAFSGQIPLYVRWNFTPKYYVNITGNSMADGSTVVTFVTNVPDLLVREHFKSIMSSVSTSAITGTLTKSNGVWTLSSADTRSRSYANEPWYLYFDVTLPSGDVVACYESYVNWVNRYLMITSATVDTTDPDHTVINIPFTHGGIDSFSTGSVLASQYDEDEDDWVTLYVFSYSDGVVVTENTTESGRKVRLSYPIVANSVYIHSNEVTPS